MASFERGDAVIQKHTTWPAYVLGKVRNYANTHDLYVCQKMDENRLPVKRMFLASEGDLRLQGPDVPKPTPELKSSKY